LIVALGIDTGGTYTDAVLVDHETGEVLFAAKSLTTYDDLSRGIDSAVEGVFCQAGAPQAEEVKLVGLSTTLATNAIVEGRGGRVCLILIGYDPGLIDEYGLKEELVTRDVVHLAGGHDFQGEEAVPLDLGGLEKAVLGRREGVDAFGVSAYFGVRNPDHELRAKALIEKLTGKPVTCGHELTSRLDSIRRATTVALNASLVPLIKELISTVGLVLSRRSISGQLMVVKGDGSLVDAAWAAARPIETILSGPAASVVGASHLNGRTGKKTDRLWVMDIGGTTTDIALLKEGRPRLSPEGARVGRWRTFVEAVDVRTVALGGDSLASFDPDGGLTLGPRRVIPLCQLALDRPRIIDELRRQVHRRPRLEMAAIFLTAEVRPNRDLSRWERELLGRLAQGPLSWDLLLEQEGPAAFLPQSIYHLAGQRLIALAGFTPTDALHVLGRLDLWSAEAAELAAEVIAAKLGLKPKEVAERVVEEVVTGAARELATKALMDEGLTPDWEREPTAARLLAKGLGRAPGQGLSVSLTLAHPVAAIGAPVAVYGPPAAELLKTELVLPHRAEVANAVGAVVSGVIIRHTTEVKPLDGLEIYRLRLPEKVVDFEDLEEAVRTAESEITAWLREQAAQAGAAQVKISLERKDHRVRIGPSRSEDLFLGTELNFVAVGRPSPAV